MKVTIDPIGGKSMKRIFSIMMIVLTISALVLGAEYANQPRALEKAAMTSDAWMNANRMNGVFRNNGTWFYDNVLGDWGLEWPKGSGLSPIFGAGQYIGAKIDGEIRVAGVQHSATEFQPGLILQTDVADNKGDAKYRWYELRPNGVGDWATWPTDQGAPVDATGNPLLIGDQTIYSVWNDLANHAEYGTNKLNAEVHQMAWAFDRANVMGDMIFVKWTLVNKSGKNWEDTYFVIWSDPDLGNAGDDQVGCDTTLGLGYCWNATDNDQNYGGAPPAVGIDFFQGPIVDGAATDTVTLPDGSEFPGKKMLKMTSFIYYNNDDSPQGNPSSGMDVYNFMSGFWRDGSPITEGGVGTDPANPPTKFMFSGDPETSSGWLDSNPADRRFFMTTGPFTMEPWVDSDGDGVAEFGEPGVQEIVAGCLIARGSNNLNSVTYLKAVDEIAQIAYEINFELPPAPKTPIVSVSELLNEVVLTWDERSEYNDDGSAYEQEDLVANGLVGQKMVVGSEYKEVTDGTFNFTGYTVYQYSDASGADPVEYAKFGVDDIEDAEPYTGPRHIRLLINKNPKVANVGEPLVNGKTYYFGVQARSYCEFAIPQDFPSSVIVLSVTPQNHPGERYSAETDSSLAVKYAPINPNAPAGDGSCEVTVVDPSKTTGKYYRVGFNADATWNLVASATDSNVVTAIDTVLKNQPNQTGNDAYNVADGILVKVIGPDPGIKRIAELDPVTEEIYDANVFGSLPNYSRSQGWPVYVIADDGYLDLSRIDRFGLMTPKDYDIIFTDTDSTLLWDYLSDGVLKDTLTGTPSYGPFTVWKIDLDGTRTRLPVCVYDLDGDGTWSRSEEAAVYGPAFDLLYVYDNAAYNPADVATYISTDDGTVAPGFGPWGATYPSINRFNINMYIDVDGYAQAGDLDADGYFYGPPHAGVHIRIFTNKPNTPNDQFIFKAPDAKSMDLADKKTDLKKINVVPNPYYGYHSGEMNIFERWVRFTNLPEKCTVKIFDLSGRLVRELDKNDATTTFLDWDLKNHYGLPIASSVYVYHVDVPGVGEKIGKVAIFTPNERLDTY
jgi:hypothetical protein